MKKLNQEESKMKQEAYMILDLQYGSTGKGLLAGYLAKEKKPDVVVTAWAPNAGHTYIAPSGRKFIHRMLANGIVSPNLKTILIGPGSVVDPQCLFKEVLECRDLLKGKQIIIHPRAAVVTQKHLEEEKANVTIGSTMKGSGAALMQKIRRNPEDQNTAAHAFPMSIVHEIHLLDIAVDICAEEYAAALDNAEVIQIEGAQGFSLSIHQDFYPYCTSRDVTPAQVMADCCIPYGIKPKVYGTLRTFPIRVANRYDENGLMVGTSGGYYYDQEELSWADLGMEPELTTVTKLPRRVFNFSRAQLEKAVRQCGPDALFLNFVNYMDKSAAAQLINDIYETTGVEVRWIGIGPSHGDVLTDKDANEILKYLSSGEE